MPTDKEVWVDHEANVRCPLVGARRVGITQAKRDLEREWRRMTPAGKDICMDSLADGLEGDNERETNRRPARRSLQRARTIRAAINANLQTKAYFAECRDARRLHLAWRAGARLARDSWRALRTQYRLIPAANRTNGQDASVADAQRNYRQAFQDEINAADGLARATRWLRTLPIYKYPVPNVKVKKADVPWERIPNLDESRSRTFTADRIQGGMWRTVEDRELLVRASSARSRHVEVRVWVLVDNNNRIIERVVRKEKGELDLHNFKKFKGVLPWELECHRLAAIADAGNAVGSVVALRATDPATLALWVDRVQSMYKVYMAWCPHGDLNSLLADQEDLQPGTLTLLEEPMVWNVAEALIKSGRLMANLAATNNGDQIIHRDLKPGNVLLDTPHPNNYADYPQPRIADFGQAFMTSANDERNPDWWTGGCGTEGFTAPELERYVDPVTLATVSAPQLLEYTNVWQAGAILRAMVCGQREPLQSLFLDGVNDDTYLVNVPGTPTYNFYRVEILRMIDDMMSFDCTQRPTFAALQTRINGFARDVSDGMRDSSAPPAARDVLAVAYQADQYRIGMTPPPPPP